MPLVSALSKLGLIHSIEDPFLFGRNILYSLKDGVWLIPHQTDIDRLKLLFQIYKDIYELEGKDEQTLQEWLKNDIAWKGISKVTILIGFYHLCPTKRQRASFYKRVVEIKEKLDKIDKKYYNSAQIDDILIDVNAMLSIIQDRLRQEKYEVRMELKPVKVI